MGILIRRYILDEEKMKNEIHQQTKLPLEDIQKVLDAEYEYMKRIGLIKGVKK